MLLLVRAVRILPAFIGKVKNRLHIGFEALPKHRAVGGGAHGIRR